MDNEKMMYQLPLRINASLAEELNAAAGMTGIRKSTIARMAISRLLKDFNETGTAAQMAKFREHYEEIV